MDITKIINNDNNTISLNNNKNCYKSFMKMSNDNSSVSKEYLLSKDIDYSQNINDNSSEIRKKISI